MDEKFDAKLEARPCGGLGIMPRIVLLLGPPGSGKMPKARELARALPPMSPQTAVEAAWIWYGAGIGSVSPAGLAFRAPHHTVSAPGLIGNHKHPGEVSLAHGGTLVLDELLEFRRSCIEVLAETVRRGHTWPAGFPARPQLVVAMSNLCLCGWTGSTRPCLCSPKQRDAWEIRVKEYSKLLGASEITDMVHGDTFVLEAK